MRYQNTHAPDTDHRLPNEANLISAVSGASLPRVFRIFAKWQAESLMCDDSGRLHPALTVDALLLALRKHRPDVVSLLLAASSTENLPIKEAIKVGSISNFEVFLGARRARRAVHSCAGPFANSRYCAHELISFNRHPVQDKERVNGLLRLGADPNARFEYDTLLSRAVLAGSMDVIKLPRQ